MYTHFEIKRAGVELGAAIIKKAHHVKQTMGFGYSPVQDAPDTFPALIAAYNDSVAHAKALPVFSGASDNTIYRSAEANYAFRFWHDVVHCVMGYSFETEDEFKTAQAQIKDFHFGSLLEYKIFFADTICQSIHHKLTGGMFPDNQAHFVEYLVNTRDINPWIAVARYISFTQDGEVLDRVYDNMPESDYGFLPFNMMKV